MKRVVLYIAISIDGYIADVNGGVEWLDKLEFEEGEDHGYGEFISGIDTIVTGRKTYEFVQNAGVEWPYPGLTCYVLTSNSQHPVTSPDTYITNEPVADLMARLRNQEGKDIWLLGGGVLCTAFIELDLIDEIRLTIIPVALGSGILLFHGDYVERWYQLTGTESYSSGAVTLIYVRKS